MRDEKEILESALVAARRAVQFLESGQATGAFIMLTDNDSAMMWSMNISPHGNAIGDAANALCESGARLRAAWWNLIVENEAGGSFLHSVDNEDD